MQSGRSVDSTISEGRLTGKTINDLLESHFDIQLQNILHDDRVSVERCSDES
jgi:hypothetical protein